MLPWLIGAGLAAWGGYELLKKKSPTATPATTTQTGKVVAPLITNVKNLAQQAVSSVTGQTSAAPISDPVLSTASLVANALLHGSATDPAVMALVKQFQAATGLTQDGKYGPMTQGKLSQYVSNPPPAPAIYGGTG